MRAARKIEQLTERIDGAPSARVTGENSPYYAIPLTRIENGPGTTEIFFGIILDVEEMLPCGQSKADPRGINYLNWPSPWQDCLV
jgi:hypothetical protein